MAQTVWAYPFTATDPFVLDMPIGATVLQVGVDGITTDPTVWALVNPDIESRTRTFRIVATEAEVPMITPLQYVGSFVVAGVISHVFEEASF